MNSVENVGKFNLKARLLTKTGGLKYFYMTVFKNKAEDASYNQVIFEDITDKMQQVANEKQIVIDSIYLQQKQEFIEVLSQNFEDLIEKYKIKKTDIKNFKDLNNYLKLHEDDWMIFNSHFKKIHVNFFSTISQSYPDLTQQDMKFCALLKLNFTTKEIARLLNIEPTSVQRRKVRLKKKMNLGRLENLIPFIQSF